MDIKQHALDLVDSNRPWKSLPNGLNPPPCFTEASCIFTDRHQVRITSLLPIRKKDLVALIEDPKNDICFDPFIQSITCDSDGVYHVHNMVPTSSPIPKKFRLQILNINGAFMGIRYDCVPSTVFMSVMRITSRFEGSVFEIFFEFSPECNSVESFNVLAVNLLRKYVDSVVEYIKGDDEAKQFFEMERDLYKIFNADKKKFPILFHENNMLRILLTEDCCELLLQGEFHSLRDLVDIISWYSCNESLSVLFPISHVVKTTNRFHFHHKETWLFGEKATMDLIFGFKISDGSGVVCYSSTNEIPSDGNPNKIYVNGGSFVSVAENDKIVRYVCHLQLPFFKNFTPKRRRVALNNIATILLSFHAFSCTLQPFQVPFDPSLLTPNETMSHLLQNIYRMNTRKKEIVPPQPSEASFLNLSNEILLHVFTFVTPTEIINLSTTCRRINNLLKSNLSKQLYHVLFTKFFDVHAFDSRFESITPTIDEVRSKFYNFASSFRSQKVERKPKLISIGQSVDNVVVLSSGIACSSGKKLLRLNFDGTSQKMQSMGHISLLSKGVTDDTFSGLFKCGSVRGYDKFREVMKKDYLFGHDRTPFCFGFGSKTIFSLGSDIQQLDLSTNDVIWKWNQQIQKPQCIYDLNNLIVIGFINGETIYIDKRSNTIVDRYISHVGGVIQIKGFEDHIVSCGKDNVLRLWDLRKNGHEMDRRCHGGDILGFDMCNRRVCSYATDNTVVLTMCSKGNLREPFLLMRTEENINEVSMNNERVVAACVNGDVLIIE